MTWVSKHMQVFFHFICEYAGRTQGTELLTFFHFFFKLASSLQIQKIPDYALSQSPFQWKHIFKEHLMLCVEVKFSKKYSE